METLVGILYIGVMLYLANIQEATQQPNPVVSTMMNGLVLLTVILGLTVLMSLIVPPPNATLIDPLYGIPFLGVCVAAGLLSAGVINSPAVRERLASLLERRKAHDGTSFYNPNSSLHTAAVVLAMFALVYYAFVFVVSGGLPGIAAALTDAPPTPVSMLTDFAVNMAIALLGIGLFIRRTGPQTLARLKIELTTRHIWIGLASGVALYAVMYVVENLIAMAAPADMLALWNAPAKALFDSFQDGFLLKGLMMALVYGISEEILYRGALQPVFGLLLTACFFMLMHLQYMFTPYMLVIFGLALAFGLLRRRYSTTAAISAHIVYNLLPFLLAGFLPGVF